MSIDKTPDKTPDGTLADAKPRAAEAAGKDTVEVEWKGEKYAVPRDYKDWPYLYTFEMEQGHSAVAWRHLLGATQFARFVATDPTNADFGDFDVLLGKALGLKQGE